MKKFFLIILSLAFAPFALAQREVEKKDLNESSQVTASTSLASATFQSSETLKTQLAKPSECFRETDYKQALLEMRLALQAYLIKNNRPPKDLEEIFPFYLECKPKIKIEKDYEYCVSYVRTSDYDKNYKQAVNGSCVYLYFADPQSIYFGLLLINSWGNSPEGKPYYLY